MLLRTAGFLVLICGTAVAGQPERFYLLVGADALHYPGTARFIPPFTVGPVHDGDRLAGTADVGAVVSYAGTGTPMYPPNHLGSLSMLYRRGTIPWLPAPILGIEFLGGPLLNLDGDLTSAERSLVPVAGQTPVEIPDTDSFVELAADYDAGTIGLADFDATGCNEGGPYVNPNVATILVTIAGTQSDGGKGDPINPSIDTRSGTLTPYTGVGGTLTRVYRVENLGFELWEDSIDPSSATADELGTMQFLGTLNGWLVRRDATSGRFPTLSGEGLGSTRWPAVDTSQVGNQFNTATYPYGLATIGGGGGGDNYAAAGNGGLALSDYGGDLGGYLDDAVIPRLPYDADAFVYLESAGFGMNNSNDPVFTDTIGYDLVVVAATASCGVVPPGDSNCDGAVDFDDINPFVSALVSEASWNKYGQPVLGCNYLCANDVNRDGGVDFDDINPFVRALVGAQ